MTDIRKFIDKMQIPVRKRYLLVIHLNDAVEVGREARRAGLCMKRIRRGYWHIGRGRDVSVSLFELHISLFHENPGEVYKVELVNSHRKTSYVDLL